VYDSKERERGVDVDVNDTIPFETLQVVGLAETVRTEIRLKKKHMNLCPYDSEESERGVGVDENTIILFETLQVVGFTEAVRTVIRLKKTPMNLCPCDTEEIEKVIVKEKTYKCVSV
jgi:lipid A disaccharide synthetase